jgi:hypothetical protein
MGPFDSLFTECIRRHSVKVAEYLEHNSRQRLRLCRVLAGLALDNGSTNGPL